MKLETWTEYKISLFFQFSIPHFKNKSKNNLKLCGEGEQIHTERT